MKILLIGGGGREHAICWKIAQNPEVEKIYCTPGNGGIAAIAEIPPVTAADFRHLGRFVYENSIDFTIVGPEQPLVDGIVDYFQGEGFPIFGPNRKAAQLEGSKIFSKRLLAKYKIPTAEYREFDDPAAALSYLDSLSERPLVVKADGLAAGKGVIVCPGLAGARSAVDSLMKERIFSDAGARVVIEEFMSGEECSIFVICDGRDYITLSPAQDFKRARDGDKGKNTGGMGSYAPTPFLTEALRKQALEDIVEPTLEALWREGIDYSGVLYCGLMLTAEGPKVVEFNCRFGDPETQVVLPLLETDLLELMLAVTRKELGKHAVRLSKQHTASVVLASGGYPDAYKTGQVISGLQQLDAGVLTFHAGTRRENGDIVTSGGRVLSITAVGNTLQDAVDRAYFGVSQVHFEGMHYRGDIAKRALLSNI